MPGFQYSYLIWLLTLLPLVAGIWLLALRRKKKTFKAIGDEALITELTANYRRSSFPLKFLLSASAFGLILLSIPNLRNKTGSEKITRNGIDVMIALDVSKSMLAQDISPNRLERAKQLLGKVMDKLSDDRIGIVIFAGKSYLQMPLTSDHSAAKMYLSSATPETVPTQGTVISDALKMCYASFNSKERKYKSVILISDGEDHEEDAIKTAEKMAQAGVTINTVGIGSPQGATIPDDSTNDVKKDADGNTVITKLNEEELANIAAKGNGSYQLYTNTDVVANQLYEELSSLDTRNVSDDSLANYRSLFQYLLGAALVLLMVELFVSEIKKSKRILKPALFLFFVFTASASFAQSENEVIDKGNAAYKKKEYTTAAERYGSAVKKNEANAVAQYNLGNALYKSDKKQEAVSAYENAEKNMKDPAEKSKALYNKGVVNQNDKKLEECIATYKNALKADPDNEDARHNLQLALKKQQEQKQKDDQDKKNKKDQQDKKDQNNKDDQNNPKPKPNMSQKDADQKLQALMQKEKDLQDKLHKVNAAAPDKPEKDW